MKEILSRGITGILVSHSVSQVREMCNKILWLDHGKQIVFTDNVDVCLNAYEEFLVTKKLPRDDGEILKLAKAFALRKQNEAEKKEKKKIRELEKTLDGRDSHAAIQAAMAILRKNGYDTIS